MKTIPIHGFQAEITDTVTAGYVTGAFSGTEETTALLDPVKPMVGHGREIFWRAWTEVRRPPIDIQTYIQSLFSPSKSREIPRRSQDKTKKKTVK